MVPNFRNFRYIQLTSSCAMCPALKCRPGPMGTQSDFVLRGGTFQQVLVVLDGLRLNDPITGHFSSYVPITPGEIERIEVLKGASSAIYGSDAVGGVIHIITKTFGEKRQRTFQKREWRR
jgi:vitamin B12 transporter